MFCSVVIPFHSSRLDNLHQQLRFLREMKDELILVCQDEIAEFPTEFFITKLINLKSDVYNRSKMCNVGVRAAQGERIVLLDSDRIMPFGYFRKVLKSLQPRECVTTKNLFACERAHTDQEIGQARVDVRPDFRSETNEMHRKNMFSGNTVMFRQDYLDAGGMDERFAGYGYNDTDFTSTMMSRGVRMVFREERELHLWHPKDRESVRLSAVHNGVRYCRKWGFAPGPLLVSEGLAFGIDVPKLAVRKIF